jgi:serine/threonine-protein phosphatase 6 regulatory ankyrin repeat subunit B
MFHSTIVGAPVPNIAADPNVPCSGRGVPWDEKQCICFPGYDGESCASAHHTDQSVLVGIAIPDQERTFIKRARRNQDLYVATLTAVVIYGDVEELDDLLVDRKLAGKETCGGYSPLAWAALLGNTAAVWRLLDHGADPDDATSHGITPLMVAAHFGRVDIMRLLIEEGANVNLVHHAMRAVALACTAGHYEATRLLVDSGANLDFFLEDYIGPLTLAVVSANRQLIDYVATKLKQSGALHDHFYKALDAAAGHAPTSVLEQVYQSSPEPETLAVAGLTALFEATHKGSVDNIEWLIAAGVSPNSAIGTEDARWKYANQETRERVPDAYVGYTPLMVAARDRSAGKAAVLLRHGAEVNARTHDGYTALMLASEEGALDVARTLILAGASVTSHTQAEQLTALMYAARAGSRAVVEYLLAAGAPVADVNAAGQTALDLAEAEKHADVVVVLELAGSPRH